MIAADSSFVHQGLASRVVFGRGTIAQVTDEVVRLDLNRVLVVTSPEQEAQGNDLAAQLGKRTRDTFAEATMHVPASVAAAAGALARDIAADGVVALGGGSAIGLAKAVALETSLPILAIPTTYAGSEMTPVWGLTDGQRKRTGRDTRVLPKTVVYDLDLTTSLPADLSVTSAVNALAHAVEAMYAPDGSPVVSLTAESAASALLSGIDAIATAPDDMDARARLTYGAWLAGSCLGATTMSLHHKLCHVLGGLYDLPHAWTHTVLLPYVMRYNLAVAADARERLSRAVGSEDPPGVLVELLGRHGLRRSLADLGMTFGDIDRAVDQAVGSAYPNPREVTAPEVTRILSAALCGDDP